MATKRLTDGGKAQRDKYGLTKCECCNMYYASEQFARHLQSKGHAKMAAKAARER